MEEELGKVIDAKEGEWEKQLLGERQLKGNACSNHHCVWADLLDSLC